MSDSALNYRVEGNGKPLLLVHGFGISFNIWKNLIPQLRQHFTLVIIELPGIGASPMPEAGQDYLQTAIDGIEQVRVVLGFDTWNVLGYSTGSRLAEAYVQKYARQVCRAIFLCPLRMDALKIFWLRLGFWFDGFTPSIGNWILSGWRLKFLVTLYGFNLRPNPLANEWYAEIGALPVRVLKETLKTVIPVGIKPFSVAVPFSMIWGDTDIVPVTPRRGGTNDYFVHAQHAAPVIAAGEVADVIISVLKNEHN
jgi:pimeloyl-ACP methyl ester carboxylesterase